MSVPIQYSSPLRFSEGQNYFKVGFYLPFGLIACLSLVSTSSSADGVVDLDSRGETIRILVQSPSARAKAVAVLFAGGAGVLDIDESGYIRKLAGNFLIRSRNAFHAEGVVTAVMDAPSDRKSDLYYGFRDSDEHARDIAAVISYLKREFGLPVWLVGTSRGTESVANAAIRLEGPRGPDGIVLTATMLRHNRNGRNVLSMKLKKITVPVVIAHHKRDACAVTPPGAVKSLARKLKSAASVTVLWYEGGRPNGDPCQAFHYHGFIGQETKVISDISDAIRHAAAAGKQ